MGQKPQFLAALSVKQFCDVCPLAPDRFTDKTGFSTPPQAYILFSGTIYSFVACCRFFLPSGYCKHILLSVGNLLMNTGARCRTRPERAPYLRKGPLMQMLAVCAILVSVMIVYGTPSRLNRSQHITVMIVLGIRESPENLKLRVMAAATQATTNVILSGGAGDTGLSEAKAMRDLWPTTATANTITFQLEETSQSTCQNAFYSIPILRTIVKQMKKPSTAVDRVLVVTNDFHAPRTKLLFEQVFATLGVSHIRVDTLAAPTVSDERQSLIENEFVWLEAKRLAILLKNMTNHPFQLPSEKRIQQARNELRNHEAVQ